MQPLSSFPLLLSRARAEDGNAFKTGLVNTGDQLLAVSAVVFNKTLDYGGAVQLENPIVTRVL
jgi:hypothetical protein